MTTTKPRKGVLWDRIDTSAGPDGCWPWLLSLSTHGYGQTFWDLRDGKGRRVCMAPRAAWVETHGPIPDGLCVLHRCDNRPCCNPAHLFLGTRTENSADMKAKGRGRGPRGESNPSAKLTERQVREIRERRATGETTTALAREFGVHSSGISRLSRGHIWRSVD